MPSSRPTFEYERIHWQRGGQHVAGVDEAGRGCLAGPVVAAAVILPPDADLPALRDSKTLSAAVRDDLFTAIQAQALAVGTGLCSPEEIDELNILWAAMAAMRRAVADLAVPPQHVLVDGNRLPPDLDTPADALVKGDAKSLSIAAASVIAKVTRDRLMHLLHAEYPAYGWDTNVGYPTRAHYDALAAHGVTPYHRQSFRLAR